MSYYKAQNGLYRQITEMINKITKWWYKCFLPFGLIVFSPKFNLNKHCASLVTQMVKTLPIMQGSIPGSVRSLGEGKGNPFKYLDWRIPWTEELGML